MTHPGDVSVSRAGRRYWRTTILGVLALATLIWAAVDQFGVSRQELQELMLGTVLATLLVIVAAAVAVLAWVGLRKLFRRE
jgi:hypothetical protein